MELKCLVLGRDHAVPVIAANPCLGKPIGRTGLKSKGHNDGIGFNNHLTARHGLWATTAIRAGLTELRFNHFDADGLTKIMHYLNRLAVE